MRYNHCKTFIRLSLFSLVSGLGIVLAAPSYAQISTDGNGTPIFLPSSSSSYNQNGFNLPTMPTVSGQDVVRGSGGLSCHSAVGSNGPNFDMGLIGSNDIFNRDSVSVYGRITVPLGKRPKRVDCTKLYDLEISRLKMELQLMRAGAVPGLFNRDSSRTLVTQAEDVSPIILPAATKKTKIKAEKSDTKSETVTEGENTTDKAIKMSDVEESETHHSTPAQDLEPVEIIALNKAPVDAMTVEAKDDPEEVLFTPLVIGKAPTLSSTQ